MKSLIMKDIRRKYYVNLPLLIFCFACNLHSMNNPQPVGQRIKDLLSPLDYSRDNGSPDIKWPQAIFYGTCICLTATYAVKKGIGTLTSNFNQLAQQNPRLGAYLLVYAPLACILTDQCYRNYCFNDLQDLLNEKGSRGSSFFDRYTPKYIHQKWIALTISYPSSKTDDDNELSDWKKTKFSDEITAYKKRLLQNTALFTLVYAGAAQIILSKVILK